MAFFAFFVSYTNLFRDRSLLEIFKYFDLTPFSEFLGRKTYRGVAYDIIPRPPKFNEETSSVLHIDSFSPACTVLCKQRHFKADKSSGWQSYCHPEFGQRTISTKNSTVQHRPAFHLFRQVATVGNVRFREVRSCVQFARSWSHSNFHILVVNDDWGDFSLHERGNASYYWSELGLQPCNKGTGITQFLCELWQVFLLSIRDWEEVLDCLDDVCKVEVSNNVPNGQSC